MSSMGKNTARPLFVIELRQERAGDASSGQFRSKSLPIIKLAWKTTARQNLEKLPGNVASRSISCMQGEPAPKAPEARARMDYPSEVHGSTAHSAGSLYW